MKLIGSLTSPYVRKVRVVMAEKKLDAQFVSEDVWGKDDILKSNPLGKVPCLVLDGGEAVFDSRVIVEYLDTLRPPVRPAGRRGSLPPPGRSRRCVFITKGPYWAMGSFSGRPATRMRARAFGARPAAHAVAARRVGQDGHALRRHRRCRIDASSPR
jgi:glutathione S-transferase